MVAVVEALRDVRVDREIIRLPRWIGAEAVQLIDGILKNAGGLVGCGDQRLSIPDSGSSPADSGGDSQTGRESTGNVRDA
jgi:hypothetical protein